MEFEEFKESMKKDSPPSNFSSQLKALWYDGKGEWKKAHDLADGPSDQLSARVHAYLHRKEGDIGNADYWYRRAGENRPEEGLDEEWEMLVKKLLS